MTAILKALFLTIVLSGSALLANDLPSVILDVRTPGEYQNGHLPAALLLDFDSKDFKQNLFKLDKDKTYRVYCQSGYRSAKAVETMKAAGFKNVEDLGGLGAAAKKTQLSITTK